MENAVVPVGFGSPAHPSRCALGLVPPAPGNGAGAVIPHLILKISLQERRDLPARWSFPWWQTLPRTQGKGGNPTLSPKAQNIPPSGSREPRKRAPSPSVWVPVAALRCCRGIFSAGVPAGPGKCFVPHHPKADIPLTPQRPLQELPVRNWEWGSVGGLIPS